MDAGKLKQRIEIYELAQSGTTYTWHNRATTWGKLELSPTKSLFSSVGIGARAAKLILRKRPLDLTVMLSCDGQYIFPTSIVEEDGLLHVDGAVVGITNCVATRQTTVLGTLNRPVNTNVTVASFPAVLTEKYYSWTQNEPNSAQQFECVLVTPKAIVLAEGDLVSANNRTYHVHVVHDLDIWKNEYEMIAKDDA